MFDGKNFKAAFRVYFSLQCTNKCLVKDPFNGSRRLVELNESMEENTCDFNDKRTRMSRLKHNKLY